MSELKLSGQELYKKAKKIIPGGTQLFSKRPERFLPDLWPSYYKKAKGCEVWDLNNNHYYDFAQMGVGSCVLGYADEDVNKAVIDAIKNSSICSLNCYEEVELAEQLLDLHQWAEMVRFARTGGEACAIAIRIARAATGKSKIAFCGYHGWHDWYIAANLSNDSNLDGQLMPGLEPLGVPRELTNTIFPFFYNDLSSLERLIEEHGNDIGIIIMEPVRNTMPNPGFLEGVRNISKKIGAVLILDEVTSGFRMNLGGIHLTFKLEPDIAIFGKALGNGFPISAIIGIRPVMESAQKTFISSTFWTERIGFVASLATIKKMEKLNVQKHLVDYGNYLIDKLKKISGDIGINLEFSGIPPLLHLSFKEEESLYIQTLFAQEMLERGFLVGSAIYTTYAYNYEILDSFLKECVDVFIKIKDGLQNNKIYSMLKCTPIHSGFKRLT